MPPTTTYCGYWSQLNTPLRELHLDAWRSAALEFGSREVSVVLITHAVVCAVVYPLYTNSIYRFLAPTALVALATAWIVEEEAFVFMHVLIAAETLLAGILLLRKKRPPLLTPLIYSAAAMLPATLLFMNLTQVNIWRTDFNEPLWPSNVLLTGGLIPELCTDSLCECGCVRSGLTAVVRWELGNWSFGFSVPGFPSRPESASAKPRSEVACFQYVAASA